jgi:hypothetical protein
VNCLVLVIYKGFLSTHNATSHLWNITETFLATPLTEHTRHLRVEDEIGQCFLPSSSNLTSWLAEADVQQFEFCTFLSSTACINILPNKFIRKSRCEIFLSTRVRNKFNYPVWRQEPGCPSWCTYYCWLRNEPVHQVLRKFCAMFQFFYGSTIYRPVSLFVYIKLEFANKASQIPYKSWKRITSQCSQ